MFSCFLHQFALMAELGTSLFQITQSLIALERLLISRAKERFSKNEQLSFTKPTKIP